MDASALPAPRMSRAVCWLAMIAAAVVTMEFLSLIALSIVDGRIVTYGQMHRKRLAVLELATGNGANGTVKSPLEAFADESVHPYLGYVYDPLPGTGTGAYYGFGYNVGKPVRKREPGTVIVGVTGGSVAMNIVRDSRETLENALESYPLFAGKTVHVASLSVGGFKQPQQLMTLAYMLSVGAEFDVIVNVDGLNEIVLGPLENIPNGVNPLYPRAWLFRMHGMNDPGMWPLVGRVGMIRRFRANAAGVSDAPLLRRSMTLTAAWRLVDTFAERRLRSAQAELTLYRPEGRRDYAVTGPSYPHAVTEKQAVLTDLVEAWARGSSQMRALAEANDIVYVHVLQPNQYVPGSKPMSAAERLVGYMQDNPFRPWVEAGYPVLRDRGAKLKAGGERFLDLTDVYRNVTRPLYVDLCCHVDKDGSDMLAKEIAAFVAASPAPRR